MPTTSAPKRHGGRQRRNWVPQVDLPPAKNAVDGMVNALVAAWNAQPDDPEARVFFGPCLMGERHHLISDSLYRWTSEQDREFVARWLYELAGAIYGGTFRWISQR
jgi:hypothetical protein